MTSESATTRTFVFTDIEGSTRLLRALGGRFAAALRAHDGIIADAATKHGGEVFGSEGDAQALVFDDAGSAVAAAVDAQRALAAHPWPEDRAFRVRMGIHTGSVQRDAGGFVGMVLHETARIRAAGHGGQVLLSPTTTELASRGLPDGIGLRDLGEHRFKDLDRPMRIHQLVIEGLDLDFPQLHADASATVRLPRQLTAFVDRDEVDAVVRLARDHRVITLTGPGGIGKTRLAIEVARRIGPGFADGTWFVALDAIDSADLVPSEIASVIGLGAGSDPPLERLIDYFEARRSLLVLDNFEQVVDAGVAMNRLVRACAGLAILVTSRVLLGVYGEQEFPVPALSVPARSPSSAAEGVAFDAVRLFVDRAHAARPAFELTDENAPIVADITARLDGLPLAIELAAARLRILPLSRLRDRLDDRLDTLDRGAADLPERQRTLRGAIAWSHELLDGPERRLFARLGGFAGRAALPQIEAVAGPADEIGRDVLDAIESLTQQSLVQMIEDDEGEPRFTMLASIREFAREQLEERGEEARIARRHAEAYLQLAEHVAPSLLGPDAGRWNDDLEREHDDLRASLGWCVANDEGELGLRLIIAMWRFWQVRGHLHEAAEHVHAALSMPSVESQPAALRARAEEAAGGVAYWRSNAEATRQHYEAALRLARQTGDRALLADALLDLGFTPFLVEGDEEADSRDLGSGAFAEALSLSEELGDAKRIGRASWALAVKAAVDDDPTRARTLLERSLAAADEAGDVFQTGWSLHLLVQCDLIEGDADAAGRSLEGALRVFVRARDFSAIVLLLLDAALVARYRGQHELAWLLLGAEERLRARTGADIGAQPLEFRSLDVRRTPRSDAERASFEAGRSLTTEEAIDRAWSVAQRGRD